MSTRSNHIRVRPPVSLGAWFREVPEPLPFPLADPRCRIYRGTCEALGHGLKMVGLERGAEVLTPAYHEGVEVETYLRSGLSCRFYDLDERLQPVEDELERLLTPEVRALHLTHYLGYPQDAPRFRHWCHERGLLLIEDAAQAWPGSRDGRPCGSSGDIAIFALHEMVGPPEGAALLCDPSSADAQGSQSRLPQLARHRLLVRLADPLVASVRRGNYALLLDELRDMVPPPFGELPEGASPLGLPLETADKRGLIDRLAGEDVEALDLWPLPHPNLRADLFPEAARRRATTVVLPVHQELPAEAVERMVRAVRLRRPSTPELTLEPLPSFEAAREGWQDLAARTQNVFSSWEWASLWWRHFGAGGELALAGCRRPDGRLAAILPLYRTRLGPLRVMRFLGHGPADQLGPVCDPADRAAVARALRHVVRTTPWRSDLLLADRLQADQGWRTLIGGRVLQRESSPVLPLRGRSWAEILASRSANFRQQVRRRERRLAERHDLRYRLARDPQRLGADLDSLIGLHRARWGPEGSQAFADGREGFHREFAAVALERGWLRLCLLELDGVPVAAWYGFRFGGAESFYQSGRDPEWERESVGFVLFVHTIRAAAEDGMREYRLLRGGEAYKSRFAESDPGLETVVVTPGRAVAACAAAAGAVSQRPAGRRLLSSLVR